MAVVQFCGVGCRLLVWAAAAVVDVAAVRRISWLRSSPCVVRVAPLVSVRRANSAVWWLVKELLAVTDSMLFKNATVVELRADFQCAFGGRCFAALSPDAPLPDAAGFGVRMVL